MRLRRRSSYGVLCNSRISFVTRRWIRSICLFGVFPQGRAPELDPILEVRPYQGLVEGKYDISGLIRKVPAIIPRTLLAFLQL